MERPPAALLALAASLAACGGTRAAPHTARPAAPPAATRAARAVAPPDGSAPARPDDDASETLAFDIAEGDAHNYFVRRGPVAAHLVANSSLAPRLIVAFPAGNTGAGLWFEPLARAAAVAVQGPLEPVERPGAMRGVRAVLRVEAAALRLRRAVLGSVRFVRAFAVEGRVPDVVAHTVEPGPPLALRRTTLDGRHHVAVEIEPLDGAAASAASASSPVLTLTAAPGASSLRVRLTVLSDEPPLTPIATARLFTRDVTAGDPDSARARDALAFLTTREKLLAGSWRFLTYFGRDTLLSVRLLMPVLAPDVIEAALGSVLERLAPDGDVAHEEDIGEFAAWDALREDPRPPRLDVPRYDYKMVDDDFLLAPVLARYLLDVPAGRARAAAFLARRTRGGVPYAEALRRNLGLVVRRAAPFASAPGPSTLVALRPGVPVGNWRDSDEGLGGGRVPFDVNVALVPAALAAAERLYQSEALGSDATAAAEARRLAAAWTRAGEYFRVQLPRAQALARLRAYGAEQGLDVRDAVAALDAPTVSFPALALDARGRPVPVMHTDDGFVLLFTEPSPAYLAEVAQRIERPFPAGLRTPVGVVVANPAFAPEASTRALFTRGHYHGTVVWSWQQALLAAGLARQLERGDLPPPVRDALRAAERALWSVIEATRAMRTSELWSFAVEGGRYRVVPFGQAGGHADESNAAQLWSTVFLAVRPPAAATAH